MTAHIIISTEYYMNQPSVFALIGGQYYGCIIYPKTRQYPQDVEYWRTAEGSDSGRYFSVNEVNVSDCDFSKIQKLKNCISANEDMLIDVPPCRYIYKKWLIKRGAEYEKWKKTTESQQAEILAAQQLNAPFDAPIRIASKQLRALLLSLIN